MILLCSLLMLFLACLAGLGLLAYRLWEAKADPLARAGVDLLAWLVFGCLCIVVVLLVAPLIGQAWRLL